MLKKRLIPVVLMKGGVCVQSKGFRRYQRLGNPTTIVERLSDWASDELIYLDISTDDEYDLGRDDLAGRAGGDPLSILDDVARRCFMPLTFGGRIRTMDDVAVRVGKGADKVAINTAAVDDPSFVDRLAKRHGSQCVVVCIDARHEDGDWRVYVDGGTRPADRTAATWAREVAERGAGEILIQSIDQDGSGRGYDLELIRSVVDAVSIPVIALGGAGSWDDMVRAIRDAGASAVAAANIFNYTENSVYHAKRHLFDQGCDVREPRLGVPLPLARGA